MYIGVYVSMYICPLSLVVFSEDGEGSVEAFSFFSYEVQGSCVELQRDQLVHPHNVIVFRLKRQVANINSYIRKCRMYSASAVPLALLTLQN